MTERELVPNVSSDRQNGGNRAVGFRLFLIIIVVIIGVVGWASVQLQNSQIPTPLDPTLLALATEINFTTTPSSTFTLPPPSVTFSPEPTRSSENGVLVYSARMNGRSHLWAYILGESSPIQLTFGDWDDRDPAVGPQGRWVAFSSHQNGNWDLYLLDLVTRSQRRLTDTPGFEGHPTWSPDGRWLAYEGYYDGDLDIWILPIDSDQSIFQLTNHPGMDVSPSWDPKGRRIAFISAREGMADVFLADLDRPDDRFQNLTSTPFELEMTPAFSPDGGQLVYTVVGTGLDQLMVIDLDEPPYVSSLSGQGRGATWSPDGRTLVAILYSPTGTHIVSYTLDSVSPATVGISINSRLLGLDWTPFSLPGDAATFGLNRPTSTPRYVEEMASDSSGFGRLTLVDLPEVSAPNPILSDAVDAAFIALRDRVTEEVGWDFLANLEYAFVGLNDPLPPGLAYNDWLYTGRAFAISQAAVQAGWVEMIREDFGGQTYWRVFVRAAVQDGSLGEPLRARPWDFGTRHADPLAYDQGGTERDHIPSGYYIDFTQLAADYTFERVPALSNWRTYYLGSRFNEFVLTGGLNWTEAMLQLYPSSAILTPTPFRTPTPTPTRTLRPTPTPWWWRWRTPTVSPTSTIPPTLTPEP